MKVKGILFTIISATLFGCAPSIVQKIYSYGATPETTTFFRNFFAVPITFISILLQKGSFRITKKQLFSIAVISCGGLGCATLTLVSSYPFIGTSMATTLHFLYPVFVALICFIFFKEKLVKMKIVALILSIIGILFFFQKGGNSNHIYLGIFLSILSGLANAFYMVGIDKFNLREIPSMVLTFFISLFAAIGLLLFGLCTNRIHFNLPHQAYFFMFLNSILIAFVAIALLQIGIKYLNATMAAMLSLFEPVTSNIIGVLFMGEDMTIKKVIGSIIILGSAMLIVLIDQRPNHEVEQKQLCETIQKEFH